MSKESTSVLLDANFVSDGVDVLTAAISYNCTCGRILNKANTSNTYEERAC